MKFLVDLTTWLLDKDIRAKNALGALAGLLGVAIFYAAGNGTQWFADIDHRGVAVLGSVLAGVFVAVFLTVTLIWTAVASRHHQKVKVRKAEERRDQRDQYILNNLDTLTDWQRALLVRCVQENKPQIERYEIGEYEAVWKPQVDVLVNKGILTYHRGGVYEVNAPYYRMVQELHRQAIESNRR